MGHGPLSSGHFYCGMKSEVSGKDRIFDDWLAQGGLKTERSWIVKAASEADGTGLDQLKCFGGRKGRRSDTCLAAFLAPPFCCCGVRRAFVASSSFPLRDLRFWAWLGGCSRRMSVMWSWMLGMWVHIHSAISCLVNLLAVLHRSYIPAFLRGIGGFLKLIPNV